jgi:predicted enzyme related to lactoylglutathione lyase
VTQAVPRTPTLNSLDLIVGDVAGAAAFFRDVVGLALRVDVPGYAELGSGSMTIMLSAAALVPVSPAAGVILHFEVEDVAVALEKARLAGATVLMEPARTDWGTESALIRGPEALVIDFYRWVAPHTF